MLTLPPFLRFTDEYLTTYTKNQAHQHLMRSISELYVNGVSYRKMLNPREDYFSPILIAWSKIVKKYDLILLTNFGISVFEIPETVKTIRSIYKTLPIVILVGASVEYAIKDLLNKGVNEIFTIPNDMDFVLKTIKNIIYKRDYKS